MVIVPQAQLELEQFIAERTAALSALDMAYARKVNPKLSDHVLLLGMHKARYECVGIDPVLRHASGDWLKARNYHRMGNLPWPKNGELPT